MSPLAQRLNRCPKVHGVMLTLGMVALVLLSSLTAFAQGNVGRISGGITDQTGGSITGATVSVIDVARGITRTLTTDNAGQYSAPNLLPGTYRIRAEAKGFKSVERTNVELLVGGDIRIDVVLPAGQVNEVVEVQGEVPLLDTTSATLGGTISNQTINELPLNGRDYQKLLTLRPGVMIYPGGGGWTQSANGVRPESNAYVVDGLTDDEPFSALSVINAPGLVGDAVTVIPLDAIQEFNTQINAKAEYGWKPGAIITVGLKSGTNSLHGTAYAFGRSDSFDARNYFNPAPQAKMPLEFEQFQGSDALRHRERVRRVFFEEAVFILRTAIEDDADVGVARGPKVFEQRLSGLLCEGSGSITEQIQTVTERAAP